MNIIQHNFKTLVLSSVLCLALLLFNYVNAQTISSFSPLNGNTGTSVTITGSGFTGTIGAASVKFGGTNAQSYTVNSNTQITAIVGAGTSGNVSVTNGGTATLAGFTYVTAPSITSLSYTSAIGNTFSNGLTLTAPVGATVTFTATQFGTGANPLLSSVIIGGVAADLNTIVYSASTFTITVPVGATTGTGNVSITNIAGTSVTKNFTLIPPPTITSISPTAAASGAQIIITGTNFSGTNLSGTIVTIGGVVVSIKVVNSSTQITAIVPPNAGSDVLVTTNGGAVTYMGFTYIPTPTITSYSTFGTSTPISTIAAGTGTQIIINGTNFSGTNLGTATVKIGGVTASSITINSATLITATVPANASGTSVTVTNNGGTATFGGFTYIPTPTITSFSTYGTVTPISTITAATGTQIILNGTNFSGTNQGSSTVTIGGVAATSLTVNSSTTITVTVPANAASGNVVVTNNGGAATKSGFTYIPTPAITSYSTFGTSTPISTIAAGIGTQIIINGTNFSGTNLGAASVTIGGATVTTLTVNSSIKITATVPSGAISGNVTVTNNGGSATFGGYSTIAAPTITSYSTYGTSTPISTITAASGTQIIINGTNFSGTDLGIASVTIGGVAVTTLTINSSIQITATVPASAASGNVIVTNNGGAATFGGFTYIPTPTITSYSTFGTATPISTITAASGTQIIINGTNFSGTNQGITSVTIGGVAVSTLVVNSATKMTATVPANAASGNVIATNDGGSATFGGFTYITTPTITSYSISGTTTPISTITAASGTQIIINGTNFAGTNLGSCAVTIGGVAVTIQVVSSSTKIIAVVPAASASGNVVVTNNGGAATFGGFIYIPTPTITSYSTFGTATPISTINGANGTQIIINGTNFSGTNLGSASVKIGGFSVTTLTVNSATKITATVPSNAVSGNVTVTNNGGTATFGGFTFVSLPTITSFAYNGSGNISTLTAPVGATVTFNGTQFGTGSNPFLSSITFGGVSANLGTLVANSTTLTVAVPVGAVSGDITATNIAGTVTKISAFILISTPTITSYSAFGTITPISTITAATGTQIIINGANFSGANLGSASVTIGGVSVTTLTVNSSTTITATVPANAASGNVVVTNNGGSATFGGFTYIATPTITSYSTFGTVTPISTITAASGTQIIINGTNFSGANLGSASVTIGGVSVTTLTVNSSTTITATVPANAASGNVVVTNNGGSATFGGFTYISTPTITSYSAFGTLTPISTITAATGTQIIINGTNFSGANLGSASVTIGGVSVTTLTVNSSTTITATVPANAASGNVIVTNSGGSATFGGFTYIGTPTITSYSTFGTVTPTSTITAASGTQIIINGTNFSGANLGSASVTIGGVSVTTLTVNSSTTITATVPANAASGNVIVTNSGGSATFGGFTYIATPTITSFTPTATGKDFTVTITGTGYLGANITVNAVKFGGTDATSFNVVDASTITAVVASGTSGSITVTTTGGTATSSTSFTFVASPIITSVSPSTAVTGNLITLTGTDLSGATSVRFGGVTCSFTNVNSTTITATVPSGISGLVSLIVTTTGGTSSGNTITINNSWSGTSSSNWSTAANWNTGLVPTTEDVVIPLGLATYPVLSTDISVNNLTLNGTVAFNGHKLTILNSLTGSGLFISTSTSSLDMEGTGSINFDASNNNIKNLTINSTVSLGNALNLYGVLYPTSGTFTTGGHLTLKSVSGNHGVVATVGGTISGTVTTERFIPQNTSFRAFRDLCPIVANSGSVFNNWQESGSYTNGYGVHITGVAAVATWIDPVKGFDASQTGSGSLQTYSGSWSYATNTKTMNLNPAQGYRLLIRGNRSYSLFTTPQPKGMNSSATLRTTGNLVTGTVTYLTSGTSSTGGFSSSYGLLSGTGAFSFIGNPFACSVSWSGVLSHSVGINPEYYYLDPTFVDGSGNQSYVTYNAIAGTNSNPSSNIGNDIQPGQAFFVKSDGSTSPQVIFQEADKTAGNTPLSIFGTSTLVNKVSLQLYKNGASIDGAVAVFKSSFTKSLGIEDSKKLMNTGESLTFSEAGSQLCIEGINLPTTKDTINLQLSKMIVNTNYQLKLNANLFNGNGLNAYILDKYSKAQTLVNSDTTTIGFTTNTDSASYFNRFSLIFHSVVSSVLGTNPLPIESINLTTKLKSSNLVLASWTAFNNTNIVNYTLQHSTNGTEFSNLKTLAATNYSNFNFTDATATSGINFYRIKAIDKVGMASYSSISKLMLGATNEIFTVYPNPVTNKNFTVELNNLAIGNYTVKVYNSLGQTVLTKQGIHTSGVLFESVNIGSATNITRGLYIVKIISNDGKSYQKEIAINK